jgi:DNA helicase HerA-like ATPase
MKANIRLGGRDGQFQTMPARTANRHGLIAGATGTGKTVSLQNMAEEFSRLGVPVFMSDVKGDLSGLAREGVNSDRLREQFDKIGVTHPQMRGNPTLFWDLFGRNGHPLRTTISDMGPLLLSNLLELNDTQSGILYSAFSIADDNGLLLLDLKDLRSMLNWMGDNAKELRNEYGNISSSSVGAIQRRLLVLEEQGAEHFFGEPALSLNDLMITDFSGMGVISILDATTLMHKSPRLYATFLLWLLAELFEQLPEAGDLDKPKLVLFFDEAHLLFNRAPRPLVEKVEQVVRLIRSKGVGVYFVTQSPLDIPGEILGQLATRVQHALRAFTPKDKKAVRSVAETFRANPEVDTLEAITSLATGEALVSVLDEDGSPTPVEQIYMQPPTSRLGPLSDQEREAAITRSPVRGRYDEMVDRESAFELLKQRAEDAQRRELAEQQRAEEEKERAREEKAARSSSRRSNRQGIGEALMKSVARSVGSALGRKLVRGVLGSLLGGR